MIDSLISGKKIGLKKGFIFKVMSFLILKDFFEFFSIYFEFKLI